MPPTVLITRPDAAARQLAGTLAARWGDDQHYLISPVMQISYETTPPDLAEVATLIFTSRHGVDAFARLTPRRDWPCYAVGNTTADAAREAGFETQSADGDADALVAAITGAPAPGLYLHLRGAHAAGDIVPRLLRAGIRARDHVVYRQMAMPLSDEAIAVLAGSAPVLLPLFSPRSAALLFEQIEPLAPLFVVAISAKAAEMVPQKVAQKLSIAARPRMEEMLDTLDKLRQDAIRLEAVNRAQ